MKSLLIIAHGSRRQESNDEIRALTSRIASKAGGQFDFVHCAYLELAEPSITEGINQCVQNGSNEIIVLPYFLSAGRHVADDIPREVDATRKIHPHVCIHITPYLGAIDTICDIMLEQAIKATEHSEPEYKKD